MSLKFDAPKYEPMGKDAHIPSSVIREQDNSSYQEVHITEQQIADSTRILSRLGKDSKK